MNLPIKPNKLVYWLHSMLPVDQRGKIKKLLERIVLPASLSSNLDLLAIKYGTDKWMSGYIEFYQKYFMPIRKDRLRILEIGIGGYEDLKSGGNSLRMWRDFFPNSMIFGVDIFDKSIQQDKRIKTIQGDQSDPIFLEKTTKEIGRLDIIIDDGSHINDQVVGSFQVLFPFLHSPGMYVIEDLQTSYWPQYGGNFKDLYAQGTTMTMLKDLLDGLMYQRIPYRSPTYFDEHIIAVHFHPQIVFIEKGRNLIPFRNHEQENIETAKQFALKQGEVFKL